MSARLRELVEDERFQQNRTALLGCTERADEALRAITWKLARGPECGQLVLKEENIWVDSAQLPGKTREPGVLVYYTFDDDQVTLLDIQRHPQQSDDGE